MFTLGKIKCLECGKFFVRPASHVWQVHGLSARDYKQLHGLDVKRGIATEEYRERMRDHVFSNGTLENLKKGAPYKFINGQKNSYKRSAQTIARLKKHFLQIKRKDGRPATVQKVEISCILCGEKKYIYPRQVRSAGNFCGVRCRNIQNNKNNNKNR